jgi:hypothetical protein
VYRNGSIDFGAGAKQEIWVPYDLGHQQTGLANCMNNVVVQQVSEGCGKSSDLSWFLFLLCCILHNEIAASDY